MHIPSALNAHSWYGHTRLLPCTSPPPPVTRLKGGVKRVTGTVPDHRGQDGCPGEGKTRETRPLCVRSACSAAVWHQREWEQSTGPSIAPTKRDHLHSCCRNSLHLQQKCSCAVVQNRSLAYLTLVQRCYDRIPAVCQTTRASHTYGGEDGAQTWKWSDCCCPCWPGTFLLVCRPSRRRVLGCWLACIRKYNQRQG